MVQEKFKKDKGLRLADYFRHISFAIFWSGHCGILDKGVIDLAIVGGYVI